jgi:hypothetical protein
MRKEDTMNIRLAGLVLPLLWAGSLTAQQSARAESFGLAVNTATLNQKAPAATLPAEGGTTQVQSGNVTIGTLVTALDAFSTVSGSLDGEYSDAVSSATLGAVSILNGLITADGVVAMATSTVGNSNADGSSLSNLVVNGVQISDPAPNTRVNLTGVGYAILNEQIASAGGITVNMIHVVLQQRLPLGGYVTTGNIIVGSAMSSVN